MSIYLPDIFHFLMWTAMLVTGLSVIMMRNYVARFQDNVSFQGIYLPMLISDYVHLSKTETKKVGYWVYIFTGAFFMFLASLIGQVLMVTVFG